MPSLKGAGGGGRAVEREERKGTSLKGGGKRAGEGPKSLFGQAKELIGGLPRGLVGLGAGVANEAVVRPVRSVFTPSAWTDPESTARELRRGPGVTSELATSVKGTAGRFRHPERYGEAVREGRILGAIAEDVGNVATLGTLGSSTPVTGAVSRVGARVGGRTGAAIVRGSGAVAKSGAAVRLNAAADVPALPYRLAYRGAKRAAGVVAPRVASTRLGGQVAERAAVWQEGRAQSRILRDEHLLPALQARQREGRKFEYSSKRAERLLRDVDAQYANHLVRTGEQQLVAEALRLPEGPLREKFVRDVWGTENAPTAKALSMADDLANGRLSVSEREAFDLAWDATESMMRSLEDRKLEGFGRERPLSEEQLGDEPLPTAVERKLEPLLARAERVRTEIEGDPRDPADRGLRGEVDVERQRAGAVAAQVGPATRRTAPLERAAVRVDRARRAAQEAQARAGRAVDEVAARAEAGAVRAARGELKAQVRDYRRAASEEARRMARQMEDDLLDIGRPSYVPRQIGFGQPSGMLDAAEALREGLGHQWAGRRFFGPRGSGMALDEWLTEWARRRGLEYDATMVSTQAVIEDVIAHVQAIKELRSSARGVVGNGDAGRLARLVAQSPEDAALLAGTLDEAVEGLSPGDEWMAGGRAVAESLARVDEARASGDAAGLSSEERAIFRSGRAAEDLAAAEPALDQARGEVSERLFGEGRRAGEKVGKAVERASAAERVLRRKERYLRWLEDKADSERSRLAEGPQEVAPGKYRTPLLNAERARASLREMAAAMRDEVGHDAAGDWLLADADAIARTMRGLQDQGIFPEYLIGGVTERVSGSAKVPGHTPRLGFVARTAGELRKREGTVPGTTRAAGRLAVEEISRMVENEATKAIAADGRLVTSAGDFLAKLRVEAEGAGDATAVANVDHLLERGGHDLAKFMEDQGLVVWDPKAPTGTKDSTRVGVGDLFMPEKLKNEWQGWFRPKDGPLAVRAYDGLTRGWKHMVLAMNPHWHIGNAVGNSLMGTIGAGIDPVSFAQAATQAKKLLKEEAASGEPAFPARLYGAGVGGEMLRYFSGKLDEGNRVQRALEGRNRVLDRAAHPLQASYDLNAFVDDWGRSAVYLAKVARESGHKIGEVTPEVLANMDPAIVERATRQALKAMGDFSNLSHFEKTYLRRVETFYAWVRHITQLSAHLAVEHPLRVAWTLGLSRAFGGEPEEGMPEWMLGAIPLGDGRYLSGNAFNPYGNVLDSPFSSPGDFLRGLNPVIKAAGAAANMNVSKGRLLSRPTGTGPLDEMGKQRAGWVGAGEFAYFLGRQTPQTRLVQAATQDPVLRFDTGDRMLRGSKSIPMPGGRGEQLSRNMGVPAPFTFEREEYHARSLKGRAAARKAREKRERILSRQRDD